jgi:hypothetical protein
MVTPFYRCPHPHLYHNLDQHIPRSNPIPSDSPTRSLRQCRIHRPIARGNHELVSHHAIHLLLRCSLWSAFEPNYYHRYLFRWTLYSPTYDSLHRIPNCWWNPGWTLSTSFLWLPRFQGRRMLALHGGGPCV